MYPGLNVSGVIDPIIGPNISAVQTTQPIIGGRRSLAVRADLRAELPVAAARRVEPRFEESSENNTLVISNIGDSVALHCNIWMKQVKSLQNSGIFPEKGQIWNRLEPEYRKYKAGLYSLLFYYKPNPRSYYYYNIESVSTQQ